MRHITEWWHCPCFQLSQTSSTLRWINLQSAFFTLKTHRSFFVHATPEKFENAFSFWKRIKCFPLALHGRNLKTQQTPVILELCLRKTRVGKAHHYPYAISSVFEIFSVHTKTQSVFEKLHSRDGLVWTMGLTVEIKLRFQISPVSRAFSWRISVDGRPNHRNKAACSNFSGVESTGP